MAGRKLPQKSLVPPKAAPLPQKLSQSRQCTVSAPGRAPPMPESKPPRAWRRRCAREHVSAHRMPGRTLPGRLVLGHWELWGSSQASCPRVAVSPSEGVARECVVERAQSRACTSESSAWTRAPSPRSVGLPPRTPQPVMRRHRCACPKTPWGSFGVCITKREKAERV